MKNNSKLESSFWTRYSYYDITPKLIQNHAYLKVAKSLQETSTHTSISLQERVYKSSLVYDF